MNYKVTLKMCWKYDGIRVSDDVRKVYPTEIIAGNYLCDKLHQLTQNLDELDFVQDDYIKLKSGKTILHFAAPHECSGRETAIIEFEPC